MSTDVSEAYLLALTYYTIDWFHDSRWMRSGLVARGVSSRVLTVNRDYVMARLMLGVVVHVEGAAVEVTYAW